MRLIGEIVLLSLGYVIGVTALTVFTVGALTIYVALKEDEEEP